jgi:phospholipid-binding lipoprotein MlaA
MSRALAFALGLALIALPAGAEDPAEIEEPVADSVQGDPWEPFNRRIFAFNETLDRYALEPVATGWDYALPDRVQTSIGNFFDNLQLPVRFANDVLQLKLWQAYETLWRALINSSVGVGGLFDVASMWEVKKSDEDFGQTLGYWGTPPGPYLVLPLLGPSNPRDTVGMAADSFASVPPYFLPLWITASGRAVDVVNDRAAVLETIREERKAAFDWYAAVRSAFTQYRENRVHDRPDEPEDSDAPEADEDLYGFDEDEEEQP